VTISFAPTEESIAGLRIVAEGLLGGSPCRLAGVDGGRNSRVYRLTAPSGVYAFKTYFRHASDSRARMETEFEGLTFLWKNGERDIPRPIASAREQGCAIYEWIEGPRIPSSEVTEADIRSTTAFLVRLAALKSLPGAEALQPASEACFSARALADCLRGRLEPLLARSDHRELSGFLKKDLKPAIESICASSRERLGTIFDADLPLAHRTLSPSDFGFHNALRRPDGTIVFLDFEYFGWDDPVKMICDFLLHPGMAVSSAHKRLFARSMLREFSEAAARIHALYPLFGLKWCLILLNEFLPQHLLRRRFAGLSEGELEIRQSQQLAKARAMLSLVLTNDYRFPYGD
jgi:hypothetical protein